MIVAGASAYSRIIDFERIAKVAKSVDALFFVDMAHIAGLVAAGVHPSPVPHADVVSTTTHKTLRGPRAGMVLCRSALAKEIDKLLSRARKVVRWSHHCREGRLLEGSDGTVFKEYQKQSWSMPKLLPTPSVNEASASSPEAQTTMCS